MRAAILSVGSELLQGYLTDTNATFLAQELNAIGIEVTGVFQVGDDLARIVTALRRALDDADLVVATGGIGPTEDDLTREAVAEVCSEDVYVDDDLANGIRRYFQMRGVPMPEQNAKQAWLIPSAQSLPNPMGTAPGWFVTHGERIIILMPGVPREMYRMWREQALPRVLERRQDRIIVSRTLKTLAIGESALEQELLDLVHRGHPVIATYAKDDGVHVRITATSAILDDAQTLVDLAEEQIRERLGNHIYGYLDDPLATVILEPLARAGLKLAVWEAGNGGRLTSLLEESRLADTTIVESITTGYSRAAESESAEDVAATAKRCAREAISRTGADFGAAVAVHITEGDHPDRAQGKVALAVVHSQGVNTREHAMSAVVQEIRRRATMWACDFLLTAIRDATTPPRA